MKYLFFQNEEWLDDCQTILNDILSQPGSDLLRYPIDENEYPVWTSFIKNPVVMI